jgi:hypothetical protein
VSARTAGVALALVGAIGLAIAAAFDWFSYDVARACGWTCYSPLASGETPAEGAARLSPFDDPVTALDGLGAPVAVALVLVVLAGLVAAGLTLRGRAAHRVLAGALAVTVFGTLAIAVRTITQPDVGRLQTPDGLVDVTPAAAIGIAFAVCTLAGTALLWRDARRTARSGRLS